MPSWLTPVRRRGVEILDDPATPNAVRESAMRDVARSNGLFGGANAVLREVRRIDVHDRSIVLDVGTGIGDIPSRIGADTIGLDVAESVLRVARPRVGAVVAGSALALPLRDACADVVICSQLLHHFEDAQLATLLRELHRVSRRVVIVSDLQRSWLAAAGFWLASTALRFHPVTRHDGIVSVLRGFTATELREIVRQAIGVEPRVRRGAFWRLTATWERSEGSRGR
jgi:SAM-dependent methyltransferase